MKRPTVEQETVAEKKRESENQIEIRYPKDIQESYDTVTPNSTSSSLKRSNLGIGNYESLIEARIISAMVHLINHAIVCQNGILSTDVQINEGIEKFINLVMMF
ncbi:hypothetical protein L1887_14526 [Cichorium endivia]|nr:hypothetical protein L1887_14526 [Cichorium endivia]